MRQHTVHILRFAAALLVLLLSAAGAVRATQEQCSAHELLLRCLAATHDPEFCTQPAAYAAPDAPDASLPFRPRDTEPAFLDTAAGEVLLPPDVLVWPVPSATYVTRSGTDHVS